MRYVVRQITDQEISQNRAASRAQSTITVQRSRTRLFMAWCDEQGLSYLPAAPGTVERYLLWLAEEKRKSIATIAMSLWAINQMHRGAGLAEPGKNPDLQTAMAGIRRRFGAPQQQKKPLTIVQLGGFSYGAGPSGLRDRAAVLVGSAGCLRVSELCGLRLQDMTPTDTGVRLFIRRSKTDHYGTGARVDVPRSAKYPDCCPVIALEAWLAERKAERWLFPQIAPGGFWTRQSTRYDIERLIKDITARAELNPRDYGTHSLRAGGATYLAELGLPLAVIARHGRWKSADMVLRYVRTDIAKTLANVY